MTMDKSNETDPAADVETGTDVLSTSSGPGDLAAIAEHDAEEFLGGFPVSSEGAPSGVTGLVVRIPEPSTP
jgi:hypothetical protein